MLKFIVLIFATFICIKASHVHLATAPSFVAAKSSQVISRNYNTLVPAVVPAPAVVAAPAVIPAPAVLPSRIVAPIAPYYPYYPHYSNHYHSYIKPVYY